MLKIRFLHIVLVALFLNGAVQASPTTDAVGTCLTDNSSGKDRKDLAKWLFVGMSAHPELAAIAKPSVEATENVQRTFAVLVSRLVTEACPNELRTVAKADGANGFTVAFEILGRVGMQ